MGMYVQNCPGVDRGYCSDLVDGCSGVLDVCVPPTQTKSSWVV